MYIYCASSKLTRDYGQRKLGLTKYPIHRLCVYNTGDAPIPGNQKEYEGLWQVNATTPQELRAIEKHIHTYFHSFREKRANGNYTEWFSITFEAVAAFIQAQTYTLRQLTLDEVNEIHVRAESTQGLKNSPEYSEEKSLIADTQREPTLKERFFTTFLKAGDAPRRIQNELFDMFEALSHDDNLLQTIYKGIIQWPTGTGKTLAMLMVIVIIKEHCLRKGEIYRGILVSPKNDIFNTISSEFHKLSEFGISLYDGSNGKLSKLIIPLDTHFLLMACPDSLRIEETGMQALPDIRHVHYDEVHRITGELYFQQLKTMLVKWNTQFLTGTSATPKTSSKDQHRKFAELFGDPYHIIHKCDVDEAVQEGWIATPRFIVVTCPKQNKINVGAYYKALAIGIQTTILKKKALKMWKGGKCIIYTPSIHAAKTSAQETSTIMPDAKIYLAIDGERTDKDFVDAPADGSVRILFACDRYREGSDIKGLDLTAVLIGNTISAYILIQIQGRSLRTDYIGKEGWCLIVSPCEDEETEQDVLDRIALDILSFIGSSRSLAKKDIEKYVETYFGDVIVGGVVCSRKETVNRIQAAYLRNEYPKRTSREKYETIRTLNIEMGLVSKETYFASASQHPKYIEDPKTYFNDYWVSWYHFLGVNTSAFPQTKHEWICVCKDTGLKTWDDYKQKCPPTLPPNPSEMYEDYRNWDKEFEIEEEIVW